MQGSAWMDIVLVPEEQGLLQALNTRRLLVLSDERFRQAPRAIERAMAHGVSFVDHPARLANEFALAIDLELEYLLDH